MSQARPEHAPQGDPCKKCGLPEGAHRRRRRSRAAYFRGYNRGSGNRHASDGERPVIAIDGEGYTDRKGRHLYTYLAACDAEGLVSDVSNRKGLSAKEVFRFLCSLPKHALLVGFSLGYDRTKWVESWPDACVWRLMRPEERQGDDGPLPVKWQGYRVNLVATRMSLTEKETGAKRTVWDVWRFFQSSFVKALERWKVGTDRERALIAREKARRGSFKAIGKREQAYCQLECRLLSKLVSELLSAHEEEGLKLASYYGPGSTASLVLKEHGEQRAVYPRAMAHAVMCAYFGGRFECSRVGPVEAKELYAYDIASAYPAAMCRLPCLRAGHGRWVHCRTEVGTTTTPGSTLALCRFVVEPHKRACPAWGPLPHRLPDGNIVFPVVSAGGWSWNDEVDAARALHPGVHVVERWDWIPGCDCSNPFEKRVCELYERRLHWGKAARGLVLKLALNSLYGKSAQTVGKGRYRCMVRAGLITSMTRATLLRAVARAKDPWSILELATDSVLSSEALGIETTGLGGWERKPWTGGVFLLRPGLRFPLRRGGDLDQTAARGVGSRTLHENRLRVLRTWEREPMASVRLPTPSFFHGARLSVRRAGREGSYDYRRSEEYGTWTREHKVLTFSPMPKRAALGPRDGEAIRLLPWELPAGDACRSVPYGSVEQSALADDLDAMRELEEDQPEAGMLRLV